MRRGFLLSDGKKLTVTAADKESMKKIQMTQQVLDESLGVSMVKMSSHNDDMNLKIKVDEKGNICFEYKPSER